MPFSNLSPSGPRSPNLGTSGAFPPTAAQFREVDLGVPVWHD